MGKTHGEQEGFALEDSENIKGKIKGL